MSCRVSLQSLEISGSKPGVLNIVKQVAQLINKQRVRGRGTPTVQLLQYDNKTEIKITFNNTTCATINAKADPVCC